MAFFRVGKKIFCTLRDPKPRMMVKLRREDQQNLAHGEVIMPIPDSRGLKGSTFII